MKIACRALAIAALVTVAATFLLLEQYAAAFGSTVDTSAETQGLYQFIGLLFIIVAMTASALSFASGVVAIVVAGQHRQRIWLATLLVALILQTYGSFAVILI